MDDGYKHALALYDRASVSAGEDWLNLAAALLAIYPQLAREHIGTKTSN